MLLEIVNDPVCTSIIVWLQDVCGARGDTHKNFFFYYFTASSMVPDEGNIMLAFVIWCATLRANRTINMLGILPLVGQLSKDLFKLPRPSCGSSPSDIRLLDSRYSTEYGMPSTHVLNALLMLHFLILETSGGVPISFAMWALVIGVIISVALSRLYFGVHSFADLMGGAIWGVIGMTLEWLAFNALPKEQFFMADAALALLLTALYVGISNWSSSIDYWRASFGTATQLYGTYIGVKTALWFVEFQRPDLWEILLESSQLTPGDPISATKRTAVGLLVIVCCHEVCKEVCRALLIALLHMQVIGDAYGKDQQGGVVADKNRYCVDIPVRFVKLFALTWSAVVLMPMVWQNRGLESFGIGV